MRITLTGATGFLGARLVNRLLAEKYSITILSRQTQGGVNPRYTVWNPGREAVPLASLKESAALIHLMGEPIAQRWSSGVKQRIRSSRVDSTRQMVDALATLAQKPPVLICASAIGIYGNRGDEILTESSAPGAGFLAEVCEEWEREAMRAEEFGIRVVCLRSGMVLGRHGGALAKMLPVFKSGLGGWAGSGRQWMSWIHIDDFVGIVRLALTNEALRGVINATSPHPVKNVQFSRELAACLHRPALFGVPKFVLKLAFGQMSSVLLDSHRVVPEAALSAGYRFKYPNLIQAFDQILGQS